jgi:hypothetical protein
MAKAKEIKIDEKDLEKDHDYILARLKAYVARSYWKNEGWYMVLLKSDKQIAKSMSLFDKAHEMVNSK